MDAVEVLEFIGRQCKKRDKCARCMFNITDSDETGKLYYCMFDDIEKLDNNAQEIVDRIEKYEAEKNHIRDNTKKVEHEFEVGDWVYSKSGKTYGYVEEINKEKIKITLPNSKLRIEDLVSEFEHAEPPKEEKQKIEKLKFETVPARWDGRDSMLMWDKVNELVNVVNEMRGVEE